MAGRWAGLWGCLVGGVSWRAAPRVTCNQWPCVRLCAGWRRWVARGSRMRWGPAQWAQLARRRLRRRGGRRQRPPPRRRRTQRPRGVMRWRCSSRPWRRSRRRRLRRRWRARTRRSGRVVVGCWRRSGACPRHFRCRRGGAGAACLPIVRLLGLRVSAASHGLARPSVPARLGLRPCPVLGVAVQPMIRDVFARCQVKSALLEHLRGVQAAAAAAPRWAAQQHALRLAEAQAKAREGGARGCGHALTGAV
jgi:hypothetical protein